MKFRRRQSRPAPHEAVTVQEQETAHEEAQLLAERAARVFETLRATTDPDAREITIADAQLIDRNDLLYDEPAPTTLHAHLQLRSDGMLHGNIHSASDYLGTTYDRHPNGYWTLNNVWPMDKEELLNDSDVIASVYAMLPDNETSAFVQNEIINAEETPSGRKFMRALHEMLSPTTEHWTDTQEYTDTVYAVNEHSEPVHDQTIRLGHTDGTNGTATYIEHTRFEGTARIVTTLTHDSMGITIAEQCTTEDGTSIDTDPQYLHEPTLVETLNTALEQLVRDRFVTQ